MSEPDYSHLTCRWCWKPLKETPLKGHRKPTVSVEEASFLYCSQECKDAGEDDIMGDFEQ